MILLLSRQADWLLWATFIALVCHVCNILLLYNLIFTGRTLRAWVSGREAVLVGTAMSALAFSVIGALAGFFFPAPVIQFVVGVSGVGISIWLMIQSMRWQFLVMSVAFLIVATANLLAI